MPKVIYTTCDRIIQRRGPLREILPPGGSGLSRLLNALAKQRLALAMGHNRSDARSGESWAWCTSVRCHQILLDIKQPALDHRRPTRHACSRDYGQGRSRGCYRTRTERLLRNIRDDRHWHISPATTRPSL